MQQTAAPRIYGRKTTRNPRKPIRPERSNPIVSHNTQIAVNRSKLHMHHGQIYGQCMYQSRRIPEATASLHRNFHRSGWGGGSTQRSHLHQHFPIRKTCRMQVRVPWRFCAPNFRSCGNTKLLANDDDKLCIAISRVAIRGHRQRENPIAPTRNTPNSRSAKKYAKLLKVSCDIRMK